ncbi:MAG: OmpA family protein [Paludibacteraceae bacterium]|nr:OmpA family protein [Paludibacteraceae bacterium]
MIKRLSLFLLLACVLASCSLNSRIQKADKKFALGEYYRASEMYKAIYPNVPAKNKKLKSSVAYKLGNSYRLIENNVKAETAYKNAVKLGSKDSLVYYYYAEALRSNGKYKEAINMYEKQVSATGVSTLLTTGIESCNKAIELGKQGSKFVVTKDNKFNSKYSDFCPAFATSDNDIIYFNSTRVLRGGAKKKVSNSRITGQRNNQIYSSKTNVQGIWDNPELVDAEGINTEFDQGTVSFSADFQTMYYTLSKVVKGETLGAAIYSSERTGAAWSEPKQVKVLKDSSITVAHPAFDKDGEWLYFVSDMVGSIGGKDIWRTHQVEGEWSVPENLGATINTEGEEMFPYFGPDGTLYFSSDGHNGFGGLDIYSAEFKGDSIGWEVTNLQQPINSRYDDFGITIASSGDWGYFSSNRGDRKNYDHIYKFELPKLTFEIEGSVKNSNGDELGDAVVKIIGSNGTIANVKTIKNGTYTYPIQNGTKYLLLGTCRGFLNLKQELNVPELDKSEKFKVDFVLTSISKPVKMDNIFYEFGSAKLTPESSAGLDELVKLLNDNPNITIEIGAHTDYVGGDESNKKLSEERAMSVVNYLLEKGIEKDRLSAVGYGETEPVVPDKALVRQNKFLKVGKALTEEFIKTLTPEQQEKANQINRRTEFKVLKTTYKMY